MPTTLRSFGVSGVPCNWAAGQYVIRRTQVPPDADAVARSSSVRFDHRLRDTRPSKRLETRDGQRAGGPPGGDPPASPSHVPRRRLPLRGSPDRVASPSGLLRHLGKDARRDRGSDDRARSNLAAADLGRARGLTVHAAWVQRSSRIHWASFNNRIRLLKIDGRMPGGFRPSTRVRPLPCPLP